MRRRVPRWRSLPILPSLFFTLDLVVFAFDLVILVLELVIVVHRPVGVAASTAAAAAVIEHDELPVRLLDEITERLDRSPARPARLWGWGWDSGWRIISSSDAVLREMVVVVVVVGLGWRHIVDDGEPAAGCGIAGAGLGVCEYDVVLNAHVSAEDIKALELPANCKCGERRERGCVKKRLEKKKSSNTHWLFSQMVQRRGVLRRRCCSSRWRESTEGSPKAFVQ
jgi:hypothetical protein